MLALGSKIGPYQVESLIGEGDLASTYRVSVDGAPFAMRVLVVRDAGFGERLRRASAAQANVDHPNLLKVIDVIEANGVPAVVTEFVEGSDLEAWIASGPHGPAEVLALFHQMVDGVRAAHANGLIHRNLKPSKILVGRVANGPPRVRIADFLLGKVRQAGTGNAAVTQLGTTFGTPQYMSPEQFRGAAQVDERADLFALGCLLYEMATGQRAFDGTNVLEVYNQVATAQYRPIDQVRPGLPSWVGKLVAALLAPDPAKRIGSAELLMSQILAIEAAMVTSPRATPAGAATRGVMGSPPPKTSGSPPPPRQPQQPKATPPPPSNAPPPPPLPRLTPSPAIDAYDDDPLFRQFEGGNRSPTFVLVMAALGLGLTIGLGIVVVVAAIVAWWLGAF